MANTFAPFGFRPVKRVDGASWTGNMSVRKIAAANTHYFYKGDPVGSLVTGYVDVLPLASLGGNKQFQSIFIGCEYLSIAKGYITWSQFFPGGDTAQDVIAYTIDDPYVLFDCVSNWSTGTPTPANLPMLDGNVGYNNAAGMGVQASGSVYNGLSNTYLDLATLSNGTTTAVLNLPFQIYDIPNVQTSGGIVGLYAGAVGNGYDPTTPYNIVYVVANSQNLRAPTAAI